MTTLEKSKVTYTHVEAVESSSVDVVYYNKPEQLLFVQFHNGTIAGYREVPVRVYEGLVNAGSVGRFYNREVRGQYKGISGDVELVPAPAEKVEEDTVVNNVHNLVHNLFAEATPWAEVKERPESIKAVDYKPTFRVTVMLAAENIGEALGTIAAALPDSHVHSVEQA